MWKPKNCRLSGLSGRYLFAYGTARYPDPEAGPADFGIKFRRVDIPDQPFINADVEKVQTVERATSLAEGSVKVHTVEHILSALTGMGIDNAVIEMDANEPPIGDGSSAPYVELIKSAGIVEQEVPRRYLEVREAVTIETKGGSHPDHSPLQAIPRLRHLRGTGKPHHPVL